MAVAENLRHDLPRAAKAARTPCSTRGPLPFFPANPSLIFGATAMRAFCKRHMSMLRLPLLWRGLGRGYFI